MKEEGIETHEYPLRAVIELKDMIRTATGSSSGEKKTPKIVFVFVVENSCTQCWMLECD